MLAMSEFGHSRHFELALHGAPCSLVDEHNDACFIVRDATGQALAYFYFEDGARPTIGYFDRRFSRKWEPPR